MSTRDEMALEAANKAMNELMPLVDSPYSKDVFAVAYEASLYAIDSALKNAPEVLALVDIEKLVNKFLAWELPKEVCSDSCVTEAFYPFDRTGTNLLTANEAKQMFEYVLSEALAAFDARGSND